MARKINVTAAELRKKLDEGLRVDNSGKSTPMQRLTPFLHDLVTYLEEHEGSSLDMLKKPIELVSGRTIKVAEADLPPGAQVSSDDLSRSSLSPQTTSEQVGAPKPDA